MLSIPQYSHTVFLSLAIQGKALREAKERIALQEDVLSQKDRTIKNLHKKIQELESTEVGMLRRYLLTLKHVVVEFEATKTI